MMHATKSRAATTCDLSVQRIALASNVIDPCFRNSPQFEAESLGKLFGCRLVVKVETVNPIRSFKARGAQFFVSRLQHRIPLVCASAGNFGQGMAYAARQRGIPLTVFTNNDASAFKVARMRALGAEVRAVGTDPDEANSGAACFAAQTGALLVEDGREPAISEGAGTIAMELSGWRSPFDAVVVPLGDGGLLAGIACWIKAHTPHTRLIGVCVSGAPAMRLSWRHGQVLSAPCSTIADALAVQTPFPEALTRLQATTDEILLVDDAALVRGMRLAHQELGLVLEPAGASGLAALLTHGADFRGQSVATVLTGGNLTVEQMRQWLTR
jgi:threonine dehydratase